MALGEGVEGIPSALYINVYCCFILTLRGGSPTGGFGCRLGGGADYHEARGVSPSGSDLIYLRKYNDYFIHIAVMKKIM